MTNNKNIIVAFSPTMLDATSAIDRPFSFRLIARAPKSCTAPINIVPKTTQSSAGSHPQYAAMHGPTIGAAPAIEVK